MTKKSINNWHERVAPLFIVLSFTAFYTRVPPDFVILGTDLTVGNRIAVVYRQRLVSHRPQTDFGDLFHLKTVSLGHNSPVLLKKRFWAILGD
ncbi:MAG TPA: hypothetical protein V6D28_17925 [Leptolyngbyaceae cyanobacterium]